MDSVMPHFHLLAKPAGAACNLGCKYCFFLSKENLYGERESPLMDEAMLERHIRQLVRMEFAHDGGGLGKGGQATLYVDGKKDGEGRIEATLAMIFSADDGLDVGKDGGSAVSPDYKPGNNAFNGKVKGVQLSIADDDHSHLIDVALGNQAIVKARGYLVKGGVRAPLRFRLQGGRTGYPAKQRALR